MNVIIFLLIIYGIVKLISSASRHTKERKREREIIDIRVEQARRAEEARIMREDFKRQQAAEKARQQRQAAIEKEQERQRKEQERLRKEQERQAKEQAAAWERQRKEDAKRDAALENLAYRIDKAEDELHHFSAVLDAKNAQRDEAAQEIATIKNKLELLEQTLIDPRNAEDYVTAKEYDGPEGAILFAERYAKALDTTQSDRKKAATDAEKLRKRKATLENKIIQLDTQIFNTEQKIKKAQHDKYSAEQIQKNLSA